MKLHYLILLTIAACFTAVAFRSAMQNNPEKTAFEMITEKKKSAAWCSPDYTPSVTDDIPLLSGWGNYSWKISTKSDSAQIYFNQGINMYYAFHIIESRASFDKATRFDPACAMAWWGKALAFGPNINDFGYERPSDAFPAAQKAVTLKAIVSEKEKALIEAMAIRYSNDKTTEQGKLNGLYRDAMKAVFKTYPNDENISTLYADALMLLHPWDLYDQAFNPRPWTGEIVATLKHALQLNTKQPGANHLFIHAVEASAKPEAALKAADFLSAAMPDISHLTHMPSHIYIRTGHYEKGITLNEKAVTGYKKLYDYFPPTEENLALYVLHNTHMKLNCAQMAGNYSVADAASKELQEQIPGFYLQIPGALGNYVQYLHQSTLFTWIRFGKWIKILNVPLADSLSFTPVLQHFARAMAFAKSNKIAEAENEFEIMKLKMEEPSLKKPLAPFNSAYNAALVARGIAEGTIAEQRNDLKKAVSFFKQALIDEDNLIYNEPRDWLLPARHYLGNALIKAAEYKEAVIVFKKDLQVNPNNGWALTGLEKCYKALKNTEALAAVQKQLKTAWSIKDINITAAVF